MKFPDHEALQKAISLRHSVRKYTTEAIDPQLVECLDAEINRINSTRGLCFKLVTAEPRSFRNFFAYGKFENVVNYIIVAAPKGDEYTRICGYEGQRLVLGAQALGLNTCWVGLSFSKSGDAFNLPEGMKVRCVIAIGYGANQGTTHKIRKPGDVSNVEQRSSAAFAKGVEAALLAPTAINQQKFYFTLAEDGSVEARPKFSIVGYTQIDLGIACCNFELASGLRVKVAGKFLV